MIRQKFGFSRGAQVNGAAKVPPPRRLAKNRFDAASIIDVGYRAYQTRLSGYEFP